MTPVTRSGIVLGCAALAAGVLTAVPVQADPPPDPVSGLVGQVLGHGQKDGGRHQRTTNERGHTGARDGVLRRGCHDYPYRYVVAVRSNDWTLETFLDDRTGDTVASGAFAADSDPKKARRTFRFCRYSTYAGKFKIRAKLTWYNDAGEHVAWFEPTYFRLRRP
ncbi:hypothetical protein [Nocardioides aquiterrae]|uniref:Secreted protein n=1 Tax=Nocardioides aquiterrae TaxID=203799 RepID=A0ABN1UNM0_9ACTN